MNSRCIKLFIHFFSIVSITKCFLLNKNETNIGEPPFELKNWKRLYLFESDYDNIRNHGVTISRYQCGNNEYVNYEALCNGIRDCSNGRDEIDPRCNGECGWGNPDFVSKFNDRIYFIPNALPWTVQVMKEKRYFDIPNCQGTLIANNMIVTPASCVMENGKVVKQIEVRFVTALTTLREDYQCNFFISKQIRIHPQFQNDPSFDIALIHVPHIAKYNKLFIRPVCQYQSTLNGKQCHNPVLYNGKIYFHFRFRLFICPFFVADSYFEKDLKKSEYPLRLERINSTHLRASNIVKNLDTSNLVFLKGTAVLCSEETKFTQWGMLTASDNSNLTFIDLSNPEILAWISPSNGSLVQPCLYVVGLLVVARLLFA